MKQKLFFILLLYHLIFFQNTWAKPTLSIQDSFSLKWQIQLMLNFGFKKQRYLSVNTGLGLGWRSENFVKGLNFATNLYNGGLGTQQGVTQKSDWQADFIFSPSLTWGEFRYAVMPINTFNSLTLSSLEDNFRHSITYGLNWVMNTSGRNQLVGAIGGRLGDFSFHTYNDVKVLTLWLGNDDRWWTGGIQANVLINQSGLLSFGTEVFTGQRSRPFRTIKDDYIQPSQKDRNLNNGQTFIQYRWANEVLVSRLNVIGKSQMWSQSGIHQYLGYPLFKSLASNTLQIMQGGNFNLPK